MDRTETSLAELQQKVRQSFVDDTRESEERLPPYAEAMVDATVAVLDALDEKATNADEWRAFDTKARKEGAAYERAAMALFQRERAAVARRIETSVTAKVDDPPAALTDPFVVAALERIAEDYAPGGPYHRAWLDRYRQLIGATIRFGGRDVSAQGGVSFALDNPRARQAISRRATKLAGSVTETTIDRVRKAIEGAMTEGAGVTEIAKRIRTDAFSDTVTRSRARTIARTESVGALNEGRHLGAMESGVMQSKRWLDQGDGRVRESHRDAAGEGWISITGRFANGLLYPHEPGAPAEEVIQCRCGTSYSDLPAAEANRS